MMKMKARTMRGCSSWRSERRKLMTDIASTAMGTLLITKGNTQAGIYIMKTGQSSHNTPEKLTSGQVMRY